MMTRLPIPAALLCALASAGLGCSEGSIRAAWTVCEPGWFVAREGTKSADRTCEPCADGTFSTGQNAAACVAWTVCEPGEFVAGEASKAADRTCRACADGSYSTGQNAASCVSWTVCGAGESVRAPGSDTADRTCEACAAGTWDHDADPVTACVAWTECEPGEYLSAKGSATADRACVACTDGHWDHDADPATACVAWTACEAGELISEPGSATVDQICGACEAGTWDDDGNPATACVAWSECEPGEYVAEQGSATGDRVCAACDAGYWSSTNATSCLAVVAGVEAGGSHSCALLGDGRVKCWGDNRFGQLGLGDMQHRGDGAGQMGEALPAVDLGTGRSAKAIALGLSHTCALLDDDTVKCWGLNNFGQIGLGDTASRGDGPGEMGDALPAVDLGTGRSATAVAAGGNQTCALLDDDTVKCWGYNLDGQLGLGDRANRGDGPGELGDALPAVDFGTGRTATAISIGDAHSCALLDDGRVKCWGVNFNGHLGLGHSGFIGNGPGQMGDSLAAVDLGTGRTAKAIGVGGEHTCALLDDDSVKCWGRGGVLGLGDTVTRGRNASEMGDALPAVDLGTGRTAVAVRVGGKASCALLDDGRLKCWGVNGGGVLGLGDTEVRGDGPGEMGDALPAVDLGTGRRATGVAAGGSHMCALLDDDRVKCWGVNLQGRLGLGDTEARGDGPGEMGDALPAVDLGSRP